MRRAIASLCALTALAGCGDSPTASRPTGARPAVRHERAPALCGRLAVTPLGHVRDAMIRELSGLAVGRGHPRVLYSHQDSGAAPELVTLRRDGRVLGHPVVTGAQAVDWEDIAARRSPSRGAELFVADIGDNTATRPAVQVYRVPEPAPGVPATAPATAMQLRYPDGPHDAEALLADPLRNELVIVTKGLLGGRAYTVKATATTARLRRGPAIDLGLVTAGDVSADGHTVALRTYDELAVWRRRGREPLTRTLARAPCVSPTGLLGEGQGEALALDGDSAAITVPEGRTPVLRRYSPRSTAKSSARSAAVRSGSFRVMREATSP